MSPPDALDVVANCVTRYWLYASPPPVTLVVGLASSGPVVENETAAPEPMEMAVLMSVVPDRAVVDGVAYVLVTLPFSVTPVPHVPAV